MKTQMAAVTAALALAGLIGPARADAPGIPACADITSGQFNYTNHPVDTSSLPPVPGVDYPVVPTTPDTVEGSLTFLAPTCAGDTYTLYVLSDDSTHDVLATQSLAGNGSGSIDYSIAIGGPLADPAGLQPQSVCLYATSSGADGVIDRAPDADGACFSYVLGGGPSYIWF